MAITALSIRLDRSHYSRYEVGKETVRATVTPTPTTDPGTVTVTLRRRAASGERTLATATITFTGANAPQTVTFDLRAQADADGLMTARLSGVPNDYRVHAELVGMPAVNAAARCTVTPVTVDEMRGRWLFGLPLYAVERLAPRLQPQAITGVAVVDVGRETSLGAGTLMLMVSAGPTKTLAWAGGAAAALALTDVRRYILPTPGTGYLVVEVDPAQLPASTVSETLTIDYAPLADDQVLAQVLDTARSVEAGIQVRLEPTTVVSRLLADATVNIDPANQPAFWDELGDGVTWYKPADTMRWLSVKLPYHGLLKLTKLQGWFNRTKATAIPKEWITFQEKTGLVELVPSNLAVIDWVFVGPGFYTIFFAHTQVPQFWQYEAIVGLREIPDEIVQFIAMRAAIPLLMQAGQARWPAGAVGHSISRDGVSESRSLNPRGVYAAAIEQYMAQTGLGPQGDAGITKLRDRYRGISMIVL